MSRRPWFSLLRYIGCGRIKRVHWFFIETWLKFPNNLTRFKIGFDETTGLYLWAAALKWVMKWWNKLTSWGKPTKWPTSKDYVLIFSFFFLCFCFLSPYSWLRQSLSWCVLRKFPRQFFRTWCWFCLDVRMFSVAVNFVNRSPSSFSLSICIFYSMNNFFFMFFISWQEQMLTDFLFVKSLQSLVSKLCYSFRSLTEHLRWINLQSSRVGIVQHFLILKVTK